MLTPFLAAALALQPAPAPASPEPAPLSQENRALLRCAAAFALVAQGQAAGDPAAKEWPDLSSRGREFFVRALAQLMDATGADRAGIAALANAEAQALSANAEVQKIMPTCLLMLEATKL
ncbi:MAG: hypothetical protein GW858_11250 [Sphingomonadales bacterium]|nr:hypothetical protein [Sphingomonadales bacterium]NCQ22003.1 hypothetical protein [Sphingomonadales bacterium]NCT03642.1 hypothetical protein [Sphingomonadales bacterium]